MADEINTTVRPADNPVSYTIGTTVASERDAWDAVILDWEEALQAAEAFQKDVYTPADERAIAERGSVPDDIAAELDRLYSAESDARTRAMQIPAPDVEALRWKLDHLLTPETATDAVNSWSGDYVRQTISDYHRILGREKEALRTECRRYLEEFLRREALAQADFNFGDFADARESWNSMKGKSPFLRTEAEYRAAWDSICKAEAVRERDFLEPYWVASRSLIMTPAPDATALHFKISVIQRDGCAVAREISRPVMEIIAEDAARLAPERVVMDRYLRPAPGAESGLRQSRACADFS